jgi:rhodanese-related sulfurtransferase
MKLLGFLLIVSLLGADAVKKDQKPATAPATRPAGRRDVGVDEFEKLWKEKKGLVLDVRTAKEFEAGHIPGAVNIDVNSAEFDKKVAELEKDRTYLVHCAAGVRSVRACEKMNRMDFKQLINCREGSRRGRRRGRLWRSRAAAGVEENDYSDSLRGLKDQTEPGADGVGAPDVKKGGRGAEGGKNAGGFARFFDQAVIDKIGEDGAGESDQDPDGGDDPHTFFAQREHAKQVADGQGE